MSDDEPEIELEISPGVPFTYDVTDEPDSVVIGIELFPGEGHE